MQVPEIVPASDARQPVFDARRVQVSTARQAKRDAAFAALDDLHEQLRGLTHGRAACLATTSVTYVKAWVSERGYSDLLVIRSRRAKSA